MAALAGKAVVVTGGGRGIGLACARLAADEGASVVVNDLDRAVVEAAVSAIEEAGGRVVGVIGSVADPSDAERIIETCVEAFGRIDGLVNNAGVMFVGPSDDLDPDRIRSLFEANVMGSIFCGVPAMRRMQAQGSGSIVNLTSGAHMGLTNTAIYGASKGATASLTYDWAADLAGTGVRVNAVSPMAGTQMAADVLTLQGATEHELAERLTAFPAAEDNAPVVGYLLSQASAHLNGQVIRIDEGELSVVGRPAILRPSVAAVHWDVPSVAKAFDGPLADLINPDGLLQVTGDFSYSTVKNRA